MSLFDRAIALSLPAVPKSIVGYFSRRYIAGPRIEDALRVVRDLGREGALATVDILGEFIRTREEAAANTSQYVDLVCRIAAERIEGANVSVKLTALGLTLDPAMCLDNMRRLLAAAREASTFVRIDMEDSGCTTPTLGIYRRLRSEFGAGVGVVLQSRLRRTVADADDLAREPTNIRLCKGIYVEPRAIAYTDPELIRRSFVLILERLLAHGAYVGIATHDERLVWEAERIVRGLALSPDRYEFQMLLGVDEELRRIILRTGHRLRVYVPYGEKWHAYSVRRLRENPQIAGYAFKALLKRT